MIRSFLILFPVIFSKPPTSKLDIGTLILVPCKPFISSGVPNSSNQETAGCAIVWGRCTVIVKLCGIGTLEAELTPDRLMAATWTSPEALLYGSKMTERGASVSRTGAISNRLRSARNTPRSFSACGSLAGAGSSGVAAQ